MKLATTSATIESHDGTVVLLGCAHAGVVNTLHYIRAITSDRPIYAVLGGMHLVNASNDRIERTMNVFRELDIQVLGPAHCTGDRATQIIRERFPDRFILIHGGSRIEFCGSIRENIRGMQGSGS